MNQKTEIKIRDIGAYLFKLRKELKWNREYVAKRASVTTRTLFNLEMGRHTPRIPVLARVSAVYDMSLLDLWTSAAIYYESLAGASPKN